MKSIPCPMLWLDDDILKLRNEINTFKRAKLDINTAAKCSDGIETLKEVPIEILIIDLNLKEDVGGSGIDFCMQTRALNGYEEIPVVIYTGFLSMYQDQISKCRPVKVIKRTPDTHPDIVAADLVKIRDTKLPMRPRGYYLPGLEKSMRADAKQIFLEWNCRKNVCVEDILTPVNAHTRMLLPYIDGTSKGPNPFCSCSAAEQIAGLLHSGSTLLEPDDISSRERLGAIASYWELRADHEFASILKQ